MKYVLTLTLPNGMEVEEVLEPNNLDCIQCDEPAVTMQLPGKRPIDRFCVTHLRGIIATVKNHHIQRLQARIEGALK